MHAHPYCRIQVHAAACALMLEDNAWTGIFPHVCYNGGNATSAISRGRKSHDMLLEWQAASVYERESREFASMGGGLFRTPRTDVFAQKKLVTNDPPRLIGGARITPPISPRMDLPSQNMPSISKKHRSYHTSLLQLINALRLDC